MKKQIAASLALAAGLAFLAAGCTASESDAKPSPTTKSTGSPVHEERYNKCIDDRATVLASDVKRDGKITVGDCAEVSVVGAATPGSTIEVGTVKLLVVEADGATVHAGTAERIVIPGGHNTVTHTGDAQVEDQGAENTVTAS